MGENLYRIKALKSFGDVKEGDLGGFIENEDNLSQDGNSWIYDNARVYENARVYGNASIHDDVEVLRGAKVFENAKVSGKAMIYDMQSLSQMMLK